MPSLKYPLLMIVAGQVCGLGAFAHADPFAVGGDPRVNPSQFKVSTFASGVSFPTGMTELPDGSVLVATSVPNAGGHFYNGVGELRRFVDADNDGVADNAAGSVLATGLPGALSTVRTAGNLVLATSALGSISVLRAGVTPDQPLTSAGTLQFDFSGHLHTTYALAVSAARSDGSYDIYFNVGSRANDLSTTTPVSVSGLVNGNLNADSIYRINIRDQGGTLAVATPEQIATGLRNAAGMTLAPNGDLYFQDNGIDGPGGDDLPVSADELNVIRAADLGGAVEDFGFAESYTAYRTGMKVGVGGIDPLVAFQPVPDPMTGSRSEGASDITLAPTGFPAALRDGIFVGFHGEFSEAGTANEENPLVWVDPATGEYFHFISNAEPAIGHFDGLLSTSTALFASDIASSGNLITTAPSGVIYRIVAVPEPALAPLTAALLAGLCLRTRRRCGVAVRR